MSLVKESPPHCSRLLTESPARRIYVHCIKKYEWRLLTMKAFSNNGKAMPVGKTFTVFTDLPEPVDQCSACQPGVDR